MTVSWNELHSVSEVYQGSHETKDGFYMPTREKFYLVKCNVSFLFC